MPRPRSWRCGRRIRGAGSRPGKRSSRCPSRQPPEGNRRRFKSSWRAADYRADPQAGLGSGQRASPEIRQLRARASRRGARLRRGPPIRAMQVDRLVGQGSRRDGKRRCPCRRHAAALLHRSGYAGFRRRTAVVRIGGPCGKLAGLLAWCPLGRASGGEPRLLTEPSAASSGDRRSDSIGASASNGNGALGRCCSSSLLSADGAGRRETARNRPWVGRG